jgi:hypothetical protein
VTGFQFLAQYHQKSISQLLKISNSAEAIGAGCHLMAHFWVTFTRSSGILGKSKKQGQKQ